MGLPPGARQEVTLIRHASRATFPLEGGRLSGGNRPPLRLNTKAVPSSRRGRSQTGPQLRTSYHLLEQTRRSRGTAPAEIFADPGPSGPSGIAEATQILRAGNSAELLRRDSRKTGSGADSPCQGEMSRSDKGGRVGEYGHTGAHPEPSPVAFCLLCRRGQSRSPPAGGEIPPASNQTEIGCPRK